MSLTSYHAHTAAIVDRYADFILVGIVWNGHARDGINCSCSIGFDDHAWPRRGAWNETCPNRRGHAHMVHMRKARKSRSECRPHPERKQTVAP